MKRYSLQKDKPMYKITANDWESVGLNSMHNSIRKRNIGNAKMKEVAERYAAKARSHPSHLEKLMREFLDNHHVKYDFQKPCCIHDKGVITQFFIVDFYIPLKRIIIETDGKYHDAQLDYDDYRTQMIKREHPGVKVIRWRYKDFHSPQKMKELLKKLA